MSVETCPRCGRLTLRVVNVIGTTRTVYLACSRCCYKEKRSYENHEEMSATNGQGTAWTNRIRSVKNGPLPAQIRNILEKKGYPSYINRDDLVEAISPRPSTKGPAFHEWQRSVQDLRLQITICMSDPDLLGYVADNNNSRNRRFRRVVE